MFKRQLTGGKVFFVDVEESDGADSRYTIDIGNTAATPHNVLIVLKARVGKRYPWLHHANKRCVGIVRNGRETRVHLSVPLQGGDIVRFSEIREESKDLASLLGKIWKALGWK
jgi:hypothetical protein